MGGYRHAVQQGRDEVGCGRGAEGFWGGLKELVCQARGHSGSVLEVSVLL